ncbi:MAG: tRNA lysidine(34) synthetase [Eubacteriales bacterium]|jgi:tRNA 2-thiocytidine biosynthesis protein TtcA
MQKMLSLMRRAVDDYHMIEAGDRICVGVSGGKDSLTLLRVLHALSRFYPKPFTVAAATIDLGLGADYSPIEQLCQELEIPFLLKQTDIGPLLFDIRKEQNPCSLCAKMRRGALGDAAKELGCHKVALGHHNDDVVETFFLSLYYEGRLSCFQPVTYLSRSEITQIRPMVYMSESMVRGFARRMNLPVVHNPCPANGNTKRQYIKEHIAQLNRENHGVKQRVFGALQRSGLCGWGCDNLFRPDPNEPSE